MLQNLGFQRFRNKLPWLLQGGLLLNVENLKIQARVVFVSPPFEMSFSLHRGQLLWSPQVVFRILGLQVCHLSRCVIRIVSFSSSIMFGLFCYSLKGKCFVSVRTCLGSVNGVFCFEMMWNPVQKVSDLEFIIVTCTFVH
jgi:hypothetical protein